MGQDPRRDFSVPIPVEFSLDGAEATSEYAVNMSPRGMCLHMREPVSVGTQITVTFELPPEGLRVEASGKVVWCSHEGEIGLPGRFFEVGVHLDSLDDELSEKLRYFASQPVLRRR